MSSSNRLPWIVAACAVAFALGVLLTTLLRRPSLPQAVEAVPVAPQPRPSPEIPADSSSGVADAGVERTTTSLAAGRRPATAAATATPREVIEHPSHYVTGMV